MRIVGFRNKYRGNFMLSCSPDCFIILYSILPREEWETGTVSYDRAKGCVRCGECGHRIKCTIRNHGCSEYSPLDTYWGAEACRVLSEKYGGHLSDEAYSMLEDIASQDDNTDRFYLWVSEVIRRLG